MMATPGSLFCCNRVKVKHDLLSSQLTADLKEVGEKDDGPGPPAAVRPESEQRAGEEPAQAEGGQTQTQEVRRGLQDLQVSPYGGQDDSWGTKPERGRGACLPRRELAAGTPGRFSSNEIIRGAVTNLPYSMPLRTKMSPMVTNVRVLFW